MDYKALKTILKAIPMKPEAVGSDELANQLCTCPVAIALGNDFCVHYLAFIQNKYIRLFSCAVVVHGFALCSRFHC